MLRALKNQADIYLQSYMWLRWDNGYTENTLLYLVGVPAKLKGWNTKSFLRAFPVVHAQTAIRGSMSCRVISEQQAATLAGSSFSTTMKLSIKFSATGQKDWRSFPCRRPVQRRNLQLD